MKMLSPPPARRGLRLGGIARTFPWVLAGAAILPGQIRADTPPAGIDDYMVMTVCTDNADKILPGVAPVDAACRRPRKIRPGELPPYQLTNFAPAGGVCAARHGTVTKQNVTVTLGAEQRVVSLTRHMPHAGCQAPKVMPAALYASVEDADGQYGYIMGSGSPGGVAGFDSPALCRLAPGSSRRFTRGWVIAPAVLPAPGQPGTMVPESIVTAGDPARAYGTCPRVAHRSLTAWVPDTMNFTSGLHLPAVISNHYSLADAAGLSPGAAQQMERTYWTRAFGLSRWEKWAREDWALGGTPAPVLARALFNDKTCTAPYAMPAGITARMQLGPVDASGAWSQVMRNPVTGEQHTWYMVHCEDFTNIDRTPVTAAGAMTMPDGYAGYWRP